MQDNLNWTACGSSSDGTYLYYGKSLIVTGTPLSGTGWTLYTGAPLSNVANAATVTGLDDNVDYTFSIYCHCASSGNGPLVTKTGDIKNACFTMTNTRDFNSVSYALVVPASANNAGTWITKITVQLLDVSGTTVLYTNTHNSPFAGTVSGTFPALTSATNYQVKAMYSNTSGSRTTACAQAPVSTADACTAPIVNITNITSTSFDVNWTPVGGGSTFDIILDSSVIATGITASPYTITGLTAGNTYLVNVRRNCASGGNATSSNQNITTVAPSGNTFTISPSLGVTFTNVTGTGIPAFTFPVSTNQTLVYSSNVVSPITVTLGGTPVITPFKLDLYYNSVLVGSQTGLTTTGTYLVSFGINGGTITSGSLFLAIDS